MGRAAGQSLVPFGQVEGQQVEQVELPLVLLHLRVSQTVLSSSPCPRKTASLAYKSTETSPHLARSSLYTHVRVSSVDRR